MRRLWQSGEDVAGDAGADPTVVMIKQGSGI